MNFLGDLRETLSRDTGIEVSQLLLAEIDDLTFRKTFRDSTPVSCLKRLFKVPSQTSTLGSAAASGGGVKKPSMARYDDDPRYDRINFTMRVGALNSMKGIFKRAPSFYAFLHFYHT